MDHLETFVKIGHGYQFVMSKCLIHSTQTSQAVHVSVVND